MVDWYLTTTAPYASLGSKMFPFPFSVYGYPMRAGDCGVLAL